MPEIVYVTLRYAFLALLYAFVFLVVRTVYRELKPAPAEAAPQRSPRHASRVKRRARLVMTGEGGRRKQASWELGSDTVIGRAPECSVSLDDEFASSLHARIYRAEGRYYVEDLGSTNGTYVNGRRIHFQTELRAGDRIKIGRAVMEFRG